MQSSVKIRDKLVWEMQISSDNQLQYACNHNLFDACSHVMVISVFCYPVIHQTTDRRQASMVEWRWINFRGVPGVGSDPAGHIYFHFECMRGPYKWIKTERRRSDPVLWQKPLYQQKCQRDKVTTQTTPQKSSIKQQLRTDLGRSVGVTTATQLVWLTGLRAHLPTPRNSRVIKRTHI